MFIKRLNVDFDVIGKCCANEDGVKIVYRPILDKLESLIGDVIVDAWIFVDKISTLIIEVDNRILNAEILEDCLGFVIELTEAEVLYLLEIDSIVS